MITRIHVWTAGNNILFFYYLIINLEHSENTFYIFEKKLHHQKYLFIRALISGCIVRKYGYVGQTCVFKKKKL